ncbi:MAG: DoxX family membrane protein [Caldilineaceae bacterium]|nr:DoxX family membrane protein [Caldilineaceae bacterium]
MNAIVTRKGNLVQDPPFVQWLLTSPKAALFWLPFRLWLGWQWIDASMHKINNPAWVQTGDAVKGFWTNAIAIPETGRPPITFDWYRALLQFLLDAQAYVWMSKLIAFGEMIIGVALILGLFTGIAAFFGAFLNWNFMMAGTASSNPVLFTIAVGLILAWKVSGAIGLDRFVLPVVGTPWDGKVANSAALSPSTAPSGAD